MAITSVGYDGIVNEIQWSEMIKKVGTSDYGVVGVGDFKVTGLAGVDRGVSIAAGKAWGHGVYDTSTAPVTLQLDTVASGSRWDLIAIRRDWTGTGGATTVVKVNGTSARVIPTGRAIGPGVTDEQPLALVQITAGVAAPTAFLDLRVWAGTGGMIADNWLALTYMEALGTQLFTNNDGKRYLRTIGADGNPAWTASAPDGYIPLFGAATALDGGIPAVGSSFLVQTGTTVQYFDLAGYSRITFPKPFPNGLMFVAGFNGDDYSTGGSMTFASAGHIWGSEGYGNKTSWVYCGRAQDASDDGAGSLVYSRNWCANRIHRINWLAIGW
jgi:hypothetical protein